MAALKDFCNPMRRFKFVFLGELCGECIKNNAHAHNNNNNIDDVIVVGTKLKKKGAHIISCMCMRRDSGLDQFRIS